MKLNQILTFKIENANQRQFHRIIILRNGIVVGLCSVNEDFFLLWFTEKQIFETKVEFIEFDFFETPTLFHFENQIGIYSSKNDYLVIYNESEKSKAIKIPILNNLPKIKFPNFNKKMSNYYSAGNTDCNIVPFLFRNSSLLPVFIADLKIDLEQSKAEWLNLKYWDNQKQLHIESETFDKPKNGFTILHTLKSQNISYAFGIGDRDGGYLKPGMAFSELATINETGKVTETIFSLGQLYKENKKGGKECIFSSSGKYAIFTPAFKTDDWKNKQKIFDLKTKKLNDIELPKGLSNYRIIDHNEDNFLLVDNYINLNFANTENIIVCKSE